MTSRGRISAAVPLGPPAGVASGPLGAVQAADREVARQTAVRARAVAAFAATRPASADRPQGQPGAMSAERWAARPELLRPVSEWAANELSIALSITREAAEKLLERDLTLVHRLPGTLAALESGALHVGHVWPLLDLLAGIADHRQRAEFEDELLRWMAQRADRREMTTPAQLRDKARREALRRGVRTAANTLARALQNRGVFLRSEPIAGMASVNALLTLPEAQALHAALGAYVDALPADPAGAPSRTREQKMADCLLDLVLRPGASDRPPVQITLTLVAAVSTVLGGNAPGEVDGQVVPAEVVRQLLRLLARAPVGEPGSDVDGRSTAADAGMADFGATGLGATGLGVAGLGATGLGATGLGATGLGVAGLGVAGLGPTGLGPADAGTVAPRRDGASEGAEVAGDGAGDGGAPKGSWHADPFDGAIDDDPARDPLLTPAERQALWVADERWWAEFERRLFAGELLAPDPLPERIPIPSAARELSAEPVVPAAERAPWETGEDGCPEFERFSIADDPFGTGRARPAGEPPPEGPPSSPPRAPAPRAGGWWAAADNAVDDASQAMHRAQLALGHARSLVRTAERADAAEEAAWRAGPAGRVDAAADALQALVAAADADRDALAGLLARTAGGGLADRPRIALIDALTGALISLTDLPELRRTAYCGRPACRRAPASCDHDLTARPGLGAPGPIDGYRPSTGLDRFVRARDRRCRLPGCRRPVARGELDHNRAWPEGPTSAENLTGLCVSHHRGKHQAPGWTYDLAADGTLTVTTPTGLTAATTPPPY